MTALLASFCFALLAGCAGNAPAASPPVDAASPSLQPTESVPPTSSDTSPSTTPDASQEVTETPSDTESSSESSNSPEPSEPAGDPSEPAGSEKPPVLDQEVSGRDLKLADLFAAPQGWADGRFDVAGQKALPAIGGVLTDCEENQGEHDQELELRLANNFTKISMRVGQSDESEQSDAVLTVQLTGNGKYIDSVAVPFNRINSLVVPVKDVNALKIAVWIGGDKCESFKSVGAVLMGLRVE